MKYAQQYLSTAVGIIAGYNGTLPLNIYLKQYFAANKKYGGKDRKYIAHFCFIYFRLANALTGFLVAETIKIGLFVCNDALEDLVVLFDDNWVQNWKPSIAERIDFIQFIHPTFTPTHIFIWANELSEAIDGKAFATSHLIQPDLFLRIRPTHTNTVLQKLQAANIDVTILKNNCLALPNASKIDTVLAVDREVVVQDYSSQCIAEFLQPLLSTINHQQVSFSVWDCCAASGGKSILAKDVLGNINLTVSDVRSSIIQNLKVRFATAGIIDYQSFINDLTTNGSLAIGHNNKANREQVNHKSPITNQTFNLIICDAPCTGSGTWSRTPEQLLFFKQNTIAKYAKLQRQIVANTIEYLAPNGYFLYITCSVFKQENEEVVAFILQQNPSLKLIKQQLLIGYDKKADSMFAALFGV